MKDGDDLRRNVREMAKRARSACVALACRSAEEKNRALYETADELERNQDLLIKENLKALGAGEKIPLSGAVMDRLRLTPAVIKAMAGGLREIARLPDPVGEILRMWKRPNGLLVGRMRIP